MIKIKRAFEKVNKSDGKRILVDRLWPRGISKSKISLDEWLKDVSPSTELRKEFSHAQEKWKSFKSAYLKELRKASAKKAVEHLIDLAKSSDITLVYSAHDEQYNNAVVLKEHLDRKLKNLNQK